MRFRKPFKGKGRTKKGDHARVIALWNPSVSADKYCADEVYQNHILEQYKLYVEMNEKLGEKRNTANTLFLTIQTVIIGGIGVAIERGVVLLQKWVIVFPLLSVLILCTAWFLLLHSYKQLSTAKFQVIDAFEERLPARPYVSAEWGLLKDNYLSLTSLEKWLPVSFGLLYTLLTVLYYFFA